MNAGMDLSKALRQAVANAAHTQEPRYVTSYGGHWWLRRERPTWRYDLPTYWEALPDGTVTEQPTPRPPWETGS